VQPEVIAANPIAKQVKIVRAMMEQPFLEPSVETSAQFACILKMDNLVAATSHEETQ